MNKFGIVIACCTSDAHYAKACVYSIRLFLGNVPVCLFVDGDTDIFSTTTRIPGVTIMSNNDLRDPWLREHCRGWGHTKMAMLWESPFERFLYLDADTIVWGDMLGFAQGVEYDFIVDQQRAYSDEEIAYWFFNPEKILRYYPDFNFRNYRDRYACNGTFFARRGVLDIEMYKKTYTLQKEDNSIFYPADMGMWNFLVFYSLQKLNTQVLSKQYQIIPSDHSSKELFEYYSPQSLQSGKPSRPAVLHFCGNKAHIFSRSPKVAVMNHFRLRYLTEHEGLSKRQAYMTMAREDMLYVFKPKAKKGWCKLRRLLLSVGHTALV